MADTVKLAAIYADIKSFEGKLKLGGLTAEDKAQFSEAVAEFEAWIAPNVGDVEVPRLVKKLGEKPKRVNTREELDAALADGWVLRLEPAEPVEDAPSLASALTADLERQDAKTGICAVNADKAKNLIASADSPNVLDVLEAEENANTPQPRVSVLKAIEKRRAELAGG